MHTNLITPVLNAIAHRMLTAGDRVNVAVSAGADSVALCGYWMSSSGDRHSPCRSAFQSQLRGVESDADEAFVAELAGWEFLASRRCRRRARSRGWN
jgi:tRNA(Ile)-lysidine synthase TilS/MesJ